MSITAHQHIGWKITPPPVSCANAAFAYQKGIGTEDITFTTKRVKAVALQWNATSGVSFIWNTWDPYALTPALTRGLITKVQLDRSGNLQQGCVDTGP